MRATFVLFCVLRSVFAKICSEALQQRDRISEDVFSAAIPEATQTPYNFEVKLHLGPLDRFPYTHEIFDVQCGDRPNTIETDEGILSTFTQECLYPSGAGSVTQFTDSGCDTWIELSWTDQHAGKYNYTVLALNAKGEPHWVAHSIPDAQTAMDITNCWATSSIECASRNARHNCVWQPPDIKFTGTNRAHGRCVGNNKNLGYLDLNYHGPNDLNAQVGPQGNVATAPTADIFYAGILKNFQTFGLQTQGKERMTFVLLYNEVNDHPPSPWVPDPSNLQLSYSRQFIKPVGVSWYWAYGLDRYARKYTPYACTVVPDTGVWGEAIDITFSCDHCKAALNGASGAPRLLSSDMVPSRAWDRDAATGYASWEPSGGFTMAELTTPSVVSMIRFRPLPGHESAMLLGRFVGTPEGGGADIPFGTISSLPNSSPAWGELIVPTTMTQKITHVTYYGTAGSHSRVADIELFYRCGGEHSTEGDTVKAVDPADGCDGAPVYGTTEGRTDLECLWRGSSECFAFPDYCEWDGLEQMCKQKVYGAKKTFTFTGSGDGVVVHFCYEGLLVPMPFVLSEARTASPFVPPPVPPPPLIPPGLLTQPPSVSFTPYPTATFSPSTPAPPTTMPAPPPTISPTEVPIPTIITAVPTPIPSDPLPPVPPPPFLTEDFLEILTVSSAVAAGVASNYEEGVYRYLDLPEWTAVSGVPFRTVIFVPRFSEVFTRRVASVGQGTIPLLETRCSLLNEYGSYADPPYGAHTFKSFLTGNTAPMQTDRAVFVNMALSMQASTTSTFSVSCALYALHPDTSAILLQGAPLVKTVRVETLQGAYPKATLGSDGKPLRVVKMRLGVTQGEAHVATLRTIIATALQVDEGTVDVAVSPTVAARSGVLLQQTSLTCLEDPSLTRSTEVWVYLRGVANVPESVRMETLLNLLTDTDSPLATQLCGVLEASANIPTDSEATLFASATPTPPGSLRPAEGVTKVEAGSGGGGGGDGTVVLVVLVVVLVVVCLCVVFGVFMWKRHRARNGGGGAHKAHPVESGESYRSEGKEDTAELSPSREFSPGPYDNPASSPSGNPILSAFPTSASPLPSEASNSPKSTRKPDIIEVEDD